MKDFSILLAPRAQQTLRLDRQLRCAITHIVPAPALDAIALCRVDNDRLHITLTNASWLSRLRFSENALLAEVKNLNLPASKVVWHVLPGRIQPPRSPSIRQDALEVPAGAPARVSQAAEQFEDENLRKAFKRVAQTMQSHIDNRNR